MVESIFPSAKRTNKKEINQMKQAVISLLSFETNLINKVFSQIKSDPASFNDVKLADILSTDIDNAHGMYEMLLHIVHMQNRHSVDLSLIKDELSQIGAAKDKVENFITQLSELSEETKRNLDVHNFASVYVEDLPHLKGIRISVYHEWMRSDEKDEPTGIVPIAVLQFITQQEGDEEKRFNVYLPINEVERFVRIIESSVKKAKEEVLQFKRSLDGNLFVLEG